MSFFVIDLEEKIIKQDSEVRFTLKPLFNKSDLYFSLLAHKIYFAKRKLGGQELRNSGKSFLSMSPGVVI